ncbi:MAG: hypothetical protein IPM24_15360 [Bryobacterales bacterium]|nr:hypothetical protein [Bryobacterales bacterium]
MRQCVAAALLCLVAGCGYVGDPLPPQLHIPEPVTDLAVIQRGDAIVARFTLPTMNTDGLLLRGVGRVQVRIGEGGDPFNLDAWAAGGEAIDFSGDDLQPGTVLERTIPARPRAGREVVLGVSVFGHTGKTQGWSNLVSLRVREPLQTPAPPRAENDLAGLRLAWESVHAEALYRVYRDAEGGMPVLAATIPEVEWLDDTIVRGIAYRYRIQAFFPGERVESEMSDAVMFTPEDTFGPPAPEDVRVVAAESGIALTWAPPAAEDLAGFRVYRATGEADWEVVADGLTEPAYTDRQVEAGQTYRYAVSALDRSGNEGDRSEPVSAAALQ